MRLATFQPRYPKQNPILKCWVFLEETIGYIPIFCFKADTIKSFAAGYKMVTPSCPEKLIVFETDNFIAVDVVKWNRLLSKIINNTTNCTKITIPVKEFEKCKCKQSSPRAEFLVPEIENIIFEKCPIQGVFETIIKRSTEDKLLMEEKIKRFRMFWNENLAEEKDDFELDWASEFCDLEKLRNEVMNDKDMLNFDNFNKATKEYVMVSVNNQFKQAYQNILRYAWLVDFNVLDYFAEKCNIKNEWKVKTLEPPFLQKAAAIEHLSTLLYASRDMQYITNENFDSIYNFYTNEFIIKK